jgi:hypothetical protein
MLHWLAGNSAGLEHYLEKQLEKERFLGMALRHWLELWAEEKQRGLGQL